MRVLLLFFVAVTALVIAGTHAQEPECPGCTFTIGYWKNHPEAWPPGNFFLCGFPYATIIDNQACAALGFSPQWCNVARQFVGLRLNLLKDDCPASSLAFNAQLLAAFNNAETALCAPNKDTFKDLNNSTALFTLYNEGDFFNGPEHCGDEDNGNGNGNGEEPECRLVCKCDLVFGNDTDPSCNESCIPFCTLTQGYWKNHQEQWPGSVDPQICGHNFTFLWTLPTMGSVWMRLVHQYMAALFNVAFDLTGDCTPGHIQDALDTALFQLTFNCSGGDPYAHQVQDVPTANNAQALLDSFNNGNQSVEHCPGGPNSGDETSCDNGHNNGGEEPVCENCEPVLDCCPLPPPPTGGDLGCVLTQGFWKNHEELWPISTQTVLCNGLTYSAILGTSGGSNFWFKLAHQYIAKLLNELSGAFVPQHILDAQAEALALLLAECHEILPSETVAHALASNLNDILASYNEGNEGVPSCGSNQHQNQTCPHVCPPPLPNHVCVGGCTRTQGYWKNHELQWPIDFVGAMLCNKTWIEWFNTPPAGGDAFLILAHQYMAAVLNVATGACVPSVISEAIIEAGEMLHSCDPSLFSKSNKASRNRAIFLALLLDQYNNGLIGPGHCDVVNGGSRKRSLSGGDAEALLDKLALQEQIEDGITIETTKTVVTYVADPATASKLGSLEQKIASLASVDASLSSGISRIESALALLNQPLNKHSTEAQAALTEIGNSLELLRKEIGAEHGRRGCNCKSQLSEIRKFVIVTMSFVLFIALVVVLYVVIWLIWWAFFSGTTKFKRPQL